MSLPRFEDPQPPPEVAEALERRIEELTGQRCDVCGSKDRRLLRSETDEAGAFVTAVHQCRCRREYRETLHLLP